ncbi:MAG: M48 family metallopeptidase [Oscillospiraceae bacterium]|nr:M48 family metallopeptidase [Oscillospiraceae bacterium]
MHEYTLIRSDRKTLALEVSRDGEIIVRAPNRASRGDVECFVAAHEKWLEKALARQRERREKYPEPTAEEQKELIARAKAMLPAKVEKYAAIMGVMPTGVKITSAGKRFGSCSGKNSLCFSWRLMRYPEAAIDYVVVHELAHIRYKNHGKQFYGFIESVMPDYKNREKLLR